MQLGKDTKGDVALLPHENYSCKTGENNSKLDQNRC